MKLQRIIIVTFALILGNLCGCSDQDIELTGVWDSIGYGKQLIVTDSTVTLYDTFSGGCALFGKLPKNVFDSMSEILNLTADSLKIKVGLTVYEFTRTGSDMGPCNERLAKDDPLSNFDALWNTFNENYSSFDLRGIDWNQLRDRYRPMLTKQSSETELYSVLHQMLSELHDGHVFIEAPDSIKKEPDELSDYSIVDLRKTVISSINSKYLDNINHYNKGNLNWGIINGNIGYIQINNFEDLANYHIQESLSEEEFWEAYWEAADNSQDYLKDVIAGLNQQMEVILEDLRSTEFCIIDVRFNSGGFDKAGLDVLGYFTNHRTIAYTKKARNGEGFTRKQTIYIDPKPENYSNPLFILTSYQTASASETFVLASRSLPGVQTIGSNTAGVFSDVLQKRLPNGWEYGLSNEIYESPEGISYEKAGIRPDCSIEYEKNGFEFYMKLKNEINTGDIALEKAIALGKDQ